MCATNLEGRCEALNKPMSLERGICSLMLRQTWAIVMWERSLFCNLENDKKEKIDKRKRREEEKKKRMKDK